MVFSEREIIGRVVACVDAVRVTALPYEGGARHQSFDRRSRPQVRANQGAADRVDMAAVSGQGVNISPVEIAGHASSGEGIRQMSQVLQSDVAVSIGADVSNRLGSQIERIHRLWHKGPR